MVVSRRLVAVVVADVVGYSRLMERDEAGTHERLRRLKAELLDPKIAEHGGRVVKTSGDGMLVEFPSATSALRCAVEIQREMGVRNLYVAPDDKIQFRVGINLGDIIVEREHMVAGLRKAGVIRVAEAGGAPRVPDVARSRCARKDAAPSRPARSSSRRCIALFAASCATR